MLAEKINKARAAGLSDDEIATFISEKDQSFAGKFAQSREAGLSSTEVLNFLAGPKDRSSPVDPGYLAEQFAGGLGRGIQGYANTAEKLGVGGDVAKSANQLGEAIASGQRESATQRFMNPKQGDTTVFGFGVGSIPGAIAESGAGMLADLGAMAAGGAVAGPAGAIALPMASYGLREYGTQLDQRVANQGGAPATGTDQAATAASVLAQSALNRLALGKVGGGASVGNRGLVEGAKRIAGATGTEAVTEGAQQLTEQVGATAGTQKGLTIDPRELAGAAVLGGATGGAFRTAGEVGTQLRNATDALNTRGLEFKEEAGNVASEINRIIQDNKTRLGDRKGDTNALLDYESRLDVMAQAPTKRALAELDNMLNSGQLSQADHAKAKAALTDRANVEGLSVAERAIGGMGEGADAIAFAKRKAIINQLKETGGFSRDGVIKGGITAKAERLLNEARSTLTAAGLGGGLAYAGYKGLGTFGATVASLQSALPAVYALGGAYAGAKALDAALGTASPVAQVVRRFGQADNPIYSPSSELPTWADLDEAEKQRRVDEQNRKEFGRIMDRRMKAQQASERLASTQDAQVERLIQRIDQQDAKAQERADQQLVTETTKRMSDEKKAARLAVQLAQAQQKLDLARNVVRPASDYEAIATIRADSQTVQGYLDQAKAALASEGIKTRADKATKAGAKAQPETKAEGPKKGSKKAKAEAQDTGVLSGLAQSDSDTPFVYGETGPIKNFKKYLDKADTRSVTKVQATKEFMQRDDLPKELRDAASRFVTMRSRQSARSFLQSLADQFPDYEADIMNTFDAGGKTGKSSVVNRVFKYTSDEAADNARARKSKD